MSDDEHKHEKMGKRGVTRHDHGDSDHNQSDGNHDPHEHDADHEHGHEHHMMSHEQRTQMAQTHHKQTLWIYWLLIIFGFWMILFPATFSYGGDLAQPSGGRSIWLSDDARVLAMTLSDIFSGLLLIIFGWRSLTPNRPISLWTCCFVGIWMTIAPVLFWCPSAAGYLNNTLIGALVIALTILIPGMPNMIMFMKMGPQTPPGWTYNPSSWPQRWIMIVTGFAGWLVSRYLAAFQLGYITHGWDPFFGESTRQVLNSDMSHMWPISDAALGSLAYTFEFLMGFMGSPARWRTMPWMVTFFGILVIPLGLVHIFLVISQPVVVGQWCTLCLLAAAIMLPMIPLEVDEVIAMGQFMVIAHRRGDNLWHAFWKGGTVEGGDQDQRSPELATLPQQPMKVFKASIWGMSFPWTLIVCSALGVWLMFAPWLLGTTDRAADLTHLAGALVLTCSVIAMGEVARAMRWLSMLLALALIIGTWVANGGNMAGQINDVVAGVVILGLSIPRGQQREHYGSWDRLVM